jgi:hypothetical protein
MGTDDGMGTGTAVVDGTGTDMAMDIGETGCPLTRNTKNII